MSRDLGCKVLSRADFGAGEQLRGRPHSLGVVLPTFLWSRNWRAIVREGKGTQPKLLGPKFGMSLAAQGNQTFWRDIPGVLIPAPLHRCWKGLAPDICIRERGQWSMCTSMHGLEALPRWRGRCSLQQPSLVKFGCCFLGLT